VSGVVPGDRNQSIGGQVDGNEVRDLVSSAVDRLYKPAADLHRDAEKRNQFSFACIFFNTGQKLANFFTYIRLKESRSISYNSVYLILARVENFAATMTLNVLCLPVK